MMVRRLAAIQLEIRRGNFTEEATIEMDERRIEEGNDADQQVDCLVLQKVSGLSRI
jgi:hypothetical protein